MQHVVYFSFTKQAIVDSGNPVLEDWTALVYKHTDGPLTEEELAVVQRVAINHALSFYPEILRSAEAPLYFVDSMSIAEYAVISGEYDIDTWSMGDYACWFDTVIEDVHNQYYWE